MNFFKKIFPKKPKEEEKENKTLSYKEISEWIIKKKKEINLEETKVIEDINERINIFIEEINKKKEIAMNVNLNSKKAEERLKSMNEDGRKKYLEFLEDFLEKLRDKKGNNLLEVQEKIDKLFLEFTKASEKNYQRSTILIGKEMAEIKESIKKLSQELFQIFEVSKETIISKKRIFSIEESLKEIEEKENKKEEIEKELKSNKKEIENEKENKEKILLEIEKIKKSSEYEENLKNIREIREINGKIEKKIFELKQEIDFKKLSNFYHSLDNGLESVKKFRDDFKEEFYDFDGEKKLIELLKDAKMFSEKIDYKLTEIKNLKEEVKLKKQKITKDKIPEKELNLESVILKIEELKKEKILNETQFENIKKDKKDLIEKVKENLQEFSIELKD